MAKSNQTHMQDITRDVIMGALGILIVGFSSMGVQTGLQALGLGMGFSVILSLALSVAVISLFTYLLLNYKR